MGMLKSPMPACPAGKHCLRWAQVYLKDCVCSFRDEVSFSLGLISVVSWGIAEVPQIVTNFKEKSTEGLSLMFLITWIVGDLFNLFGCWLEPATLPTQFYMAVLYTVTTLILLIQTLYYSYMYKRMEARTTNVRLWLENKLKGVYMKEEPTADSRKDSNIEPENVTQMLNGSFKFSERNGSKKDEVEQSNGVAEGNAISVPIPVASSHLVQHRSARRDLYYMSARSLAKSRTPTAGSYISHSQGSWPRTSVDLIMDEGSVHDKDLFTNLISVNSSAPTNSKSKLLLCAAGMTLFLGAVNLHLPVFDRTITFSNELKKGFVLPPGRKILQEVNAFDQSLMQQGEASSVIGSYMGWMMAAIYMGGRLPQIYLNIKRGTAEGLNPLMFLFAILGNATYVGSIVVRTTDWAKIRPNMPWLVDAGVCVLLDCFIIAQFIYFEFRKTNEDGDTDGEYKAAD